MTPRRPPPSSSKGGGRLPPPASDTSSHEVSKLSPKAISKNAQKRKLDEKPKNKDIEFGKGPKRLKGPAHHCWSCKRAVDPKRCFSGASPHYFWCPKHPHIAVSTRGGALQNLCRLCTREEKIEQSKKEEEERAANKEQHDAARDARKRIRDVGK